MEYSQKVVFKGCVARRLLREGWKLVDIKPDRLNHDKSVFIFEATEGFEERMYEIIKEEDEKAKVRK